MQQTTVSLPQPAESDSFNRPPGTQRSFSFRNRPHYQLSTLQYLHTPSLLRITLSMDIHPNPGPASAHILRDFTNPEQRELFNKAKRFQLKLTRYEHHQINYIFYYNRKIIPKGLIIKCRPTFESSSCEQLQRRWTKLLTRTSHEVIKLLQIQCKNT